MRQRWAAPIARRRNLEEFGLIIAEDQHSVRLFDGAQGWQRRPPADGPPEIKGYSAEEVSFARDVGGLAAPAVIGHHLASSMTRYRVVTHPPAIDLPPASRQPGV